MEQRFDKKFSQVKLIVNPTRGWVDGRNSVLNFIKQEINLAEQKKVEEIRKEIGDTIEDIQNYNGEMRGVHIERDRILKLPSLQLKDNQE